MKIIALSSWDEFQAELGNLDSILHKRRSESGFPVSEPLFRGQSNQEWALQTTLERYGFSNQSLREYYRSAFGSKPTIETFTGKRWDIPRPPDYEQFLIDHDTFMMPPYPGYEYMVYLRHHGFPSPLLDWSSSPFVAAFFAFEAAKETHQENRVSIFAYCEYFGVGKVGTSGSAEVQSLGPYVTSHPRHFRQQSSYTICIARDEQWRYASHEEAFSRDENHQDLLWKFTLPSKERRKVLEYLDRHNLNAYSLFDSEESLMATMAMRELYLRNPSA